MTEEALRMRMKILWGALMAIAFASCSQEDVLNNGTGLNTLRASMEQGETKSRVGFTDGAAEFFWTKGDKIGVTTTSGQTFQEMILDGDGGQATGTFSGSFNETNSGYAVYPYGEQERHSISNSVLNYTLPATYNYETLDTEYAKTDGNSHNAPMWGSINNGTVSFKHLGGVIAFRVDNLPENTQNLEFVLTATNQISGDFSATLTDDEPIIKTSEYNVGDEDKKVTITFNTATGQTSGYFYVPVPIGLLGNLSVAINYGTDEMAKGEWSNITISRKDIKRATIYCNGEIKSVASMAEVNAALTTEKENLIVQVSGEVTGTENTIKIPTNLITKTTTFSFASVANDAKITIQDEDGGSYDGKIIIEIPEDEILPEVVANIPYGEVYIKQGTVTTLVSSSADNTTIIGANATVGTLTVAKGNVRIEEGGKVTKIERASANSATVYVVYEGATAPTVELGDGVELMSDGEYAFKKAIENNETSYQIPDVATLKRFRDAVNGGITFAGCTVELTETIDLNNEEWTPIGSAYMEHGFCGNFDGNNKTIKNLKITEVTPDADGYVYIGLFGVTEGTELEENYIKDLIIENVNISSNGHIVAAAIAYPYYTIVENITVKGDINIDGGDYTAGVLAYTRRCVNAKNLVITANPDSKIKGNKTIGGVISDIQMNGGLTANYSNFKASGLEITGVNCVGGISGIISSQTLDGATVENVSIICEDLRKGTVSGALGGTSTIKNISVTNVTGADKVVGATYDGALEVIADGDIYKKVETTN